LRSDRLSVIIVMWWSCRHGSDGVHRYCLPSGKYQLL